MSDFNWRFPKAQVGHDVGNSPLTSYFDRENGIFHAAIRECIQNSLDAKENSGAPVKMTFALHKVKWSDLPEINSLSERFQAISMSSSQYSQNVGAKFMSAMEKIRKDEDLLILEISDANTSGLGGINYESVENVRDSYEKGWTRLIFQVGIQERTGFSGGSFGYGKLAPLGLSSVNTVFYSTLNREGKYGFIGKCMTPNFTHKGQRFTSPGFFSGEDVSKVYRGIETSRQIPEMFRRSVQGTSVFVVDPVLDDEVDDTNELVGSVVENYYVAIFKRNLIATVVVDQIAHEISYETLFESKKLRKHLKDEMLVKLDAMKSDPVKKQLPLLGDCELYLRLGSSDDQKAYSKRSVEFFRLNGQVVNRWNIRKAEYGRTPFFCVFYCASLVGNKILSYFENESHDKWDARYFRNYLKELRKEYKDISAAGVRREWESFIEKTLSERLGVDTVAEGASGTLTVSFGKKVDISPISRAQSAGAKYVSVLHMSKSPEIDSPDVSIPGELGAELVKTGVAEADGAKLPTSESMSLGKNIDSNSSDVGGSSSGQTEGGASNPRPTRQDLGTMKILAKPSIKRSDGFAPKGVGVAKSARYNPSGKSASRGPRDLQRSKVRSSIVLVGFDEARNKSRYRVILRADLEGEFSAQFVANGVDDTIPVEVDLVSPNPRVIEVENGTIRCVGGKEPLKFEVEVHGDYNLSLESRDGE